MNEQRLAYDARLAEIKEANHARAELEEKVQPSLSSRALDMMAIYSAEVCAS